MIKHKVRATTAAFALTAAAILGTAGTLATAAPALAAPSIVHTTAAPSDGQLQSKLHLVLNTGASRAARANELENGEAGLALMDQLGGVMAAVPGFAWTVSGAWTEGASTYANLLVTVPGFGTFPPIAIDWVDIDGTWKLTTESQCTIAYYASLSC
ncbi:hypothetical protein ACFXK0_05465 [Nocardia sp. NPDC059177]|uniref:hypothetical protein n=1 Tax=Nocardia sp. NPDC059177 TaxID=3346759 RepID=UPI003677A053